MTALTHGELIRTQEKAFHVDNGQGEHIYEMANQQTGNLQGHSVAYVKIEPGKSTTMHFHPNPKFEETYTIIEGLGKIILNGVETEVKPITTIVIKDQTLHKIINIGEKVLKMIVVCSPPWTPNCGEYVE